MKGFLFCLLLAFLIYKFPLDTYAPLSSQALKNLISVMKNEAFDSWNKMVHRYQLFCRVLESENNPAFYNPGTNDIQRK